VKFLRGNPRHSVVIFGDGDYLVTVNEYRFT